MGRPTKGSIGKGIWRVADPKITLASAAGLVLGTSLAASQGALHLGWLLLTVLGIFFLEAAKNSSGEVVDWDTGADQALTPAERTPFSGGKRVLVDGLMTRGQTQVMAAVFYALGIAAGLAIVIWREPLVLWLGLLGTALAYFYHARPVSLAYRGWGELAVATAYGPVVTCGAYLVQRGDPNPAVLAASLPLGVAVMNFLWINEFPDARADAQAGKRTLVVRLGKVRAGKAFAGLVALTYGLVALLPLVGWPLWIWLGGIGLPHGVAAARRLAHATQREEAMAELVPAQAWTLLSFLLLSVGLSAGALLAAWLG